MPSSNIVAYNASSTQLHNFDKTSLPEESESIVEQSLTEWVVAILKMDIARNNKISALCLEDHDNGLVPDYNAIKARVLQEDESLSVVKLASKNMVLQHFIHLHLVLHHIIHPHTIAKFRQHPCVIAE